MAEDDLQLLTIKDVAALLQVSVDMIYDELRAGRIKRTSIGASRALRFRRSDVDAYLNRQPEPKPAPPPVTLGRGRNRVVVG